MVEEVARNHEQGSAFQFESTASFGQSPEFWEQTKIDLLVLRLPEDDLLQAAFFSRLRKDVPRHLPILVLSPAISQSLLQLSSVFTKVRMLKLPLNGFTLYRAILDITAVWEPGKQQVHPRYTTDQSVLIGLKGSGAKVPGVLRNLSVGGAFFESADQTLGLKPTDEIKIEINIPGHEALKYEFDARIVWMKDGPDGMTGYGCTFSDLDGVYQSLMKGF